jgi:hypothetical protein
LTREKTNSLLFTCTTHIMQENLVKSIPKQWLRILTYIASSTKNNIFVEKYQEKGKCLRLPRPWNWDKGNIWEETIQIKFAGVFLSAHSGRVVFSKFMSYIFAEKGRIKAFSSFCYLTAFDSKLIFTSKRHVSWVT